ncbi:MAG: polysaccharide biosynthesis C-terminal domain-containing protein [Planctomycetes bacterium]|nr:polysaccharide biosynthesis C-terminal domain-containing protein [Planctomycetota bacterium]
MSPSETDARQEAKLSSLARHSLVYSIAPLAQRFLALVLVRYYTEALDKAQWGVTQITDLLFTALIQISGTNLLAGVVRFYFDQKDERDRKSVISSSLLLLSAVSWTLVGLGILFRAPLSRFLFDTADPRLAHDNLQLCLILSLLSIPLALSSETAFRYLQVQQRSTLITTLKISKSFLEMSLRILFLLVLDWGIAGFLAATLVGELLTSLLIGGWVLSRVGLTFSWRVLRPMVAYSVPLVMVGLCQMGLNYFDRLLLRQLGPQDEKMGWVGIYGQGYLVGWLVQLVVVGSFMQIWQPWIFGVKEPERQKDLIRRVSTWALFAVGSASIAVMLLGRELVHALSGSPEYWDAFPVVPWVCAGYVFFALNGLSQVPMFIAKRTWPMFWLNVVAVAVKVLLSVVLIRSHGYVGAAMATLATFMVLGTAGHWIAVRTVGARFEHGRMLAMLSLVLAAMGAALWIDGRWTSGYTALLTPYTALKGGLILLSLGVVWGGLLERDERGECLRALRAKLGRR